MSQEFDALQQAVAANRSLPFPSYPLTVGLSGGQDIGEPQQPQLLAPRGGGLASVVTTRTPFKVSTRVTPDSDPVTLDRIVSIHSRVLTEITPIGAASPTGIAATDIPASDDAAWKLFIPDDIIWLQVDFTAGEPTSYAIKSLGAGDDWDDFEGGKSLVEWDGDGSGGDPFVQTIARAVIARGPSDEAVVPQPILVQVAHADFLLVHYDANGKMMLLIEPFCGAAV